MQISDVCNPFMTFNDISYLFKKSGMVGVNVNFSCSTIN